MLTTQNGMKHPEMEKNWAETNHSRFQGGGVPGMDRQTNHQLTGRMTSQLHSKKHLTFIYIFWLFWMFHTCQFVKNIFDSSVDLSKILFSTSNCVHMLMRRHNNAFAARHYAAEHSFF